MLSCRPCLAVCMSNAVLCVITVSNETPEHVVVSPVSGCVSNAVLCVITVSNETPELFCHVARVWLYV